MKKWLFILFFSIFFSVLGINKVYAAVSWYQGFYVMFTYNIEELSGKDYYYLNYYFEYTTPLFHPSYNPSICIEKGENWYQAISFDLSTSKEKSETDDVGNTIFYHEGVVEIPVVLVDGSDFRNPDKVYLQFFYMNMDGTADSEQLVGDILVPEPTMVPTSTPKPTPTNTPTPTPSSTPKPTPTNTPKPTSTPKPTPTNTPIPTPTPTPGPILELNAFITSKDAVAQYRTGGCTSVKSLIEFYEVDISADNLTKVNSEEFISGIGTMRNIMTPGKVYRYKLTYIFQRNGIQYEKFLWSDDLTIVDQELVDYQSNKKITDLRTLMLYIWEDLMSLEMPIEGFKISFQVWYIWIFVAIALLAFLKWYTDMYNK